MGKRKSGGLNIGLGIGGSKKITQGDSRTNPQFYEDWDVNNDGDINVTDARMWADQGRPELAQRVAGMIGSGNMPRKRADLKRDTQRKVKTLYGIPKKRWMKLNIQQRKGAIQRFGMSRRAAVQRGRRRSRMVRGAERLSGGEVGGREQGTLRRTSGRMHFMLEKARRKRRIKRGL